MGMGVAFTLAQFSTNNISMLLKLILLVVIAVALLPKIIISAFYFYNSLYQWTRILMIELIATVVLLLLGMSLCALGMVGQQKKDLLTV